MITRDQLVSKLVTELEDALAKIKELEAKDLEAKLQPKLFIPDSNTIAAEMEEHRTKAEQDTKIKGLETSVKELANTCQKYTQTINDLKIVNKDQSITIEEYNKSIDNLRERNKDLETQLQDANINVDECAYMLEKAATRINELRTENRDLRDKVNVYKFVLETETADMPLGHLLKGNFVPPPKPLVDDTDDPNELKRRIDVLNGVIASLKESIGRQNIAYLKLQNENRKLTDHNTESREDYLIVINDPNNPLTPDLFYVDDLSPIRGLCQEYREDFNLFYRNGRAAQCVSLAQFILDHYGPKRSRPARPTILNCANLRSPLTDEELDSIKDKLRGTATEEDVD